VIPFRAAKKRCVLLGGDNKGRGKGKEARREKELSGLIYCPALSQRIKEGIPDARKKKEFSMGGEREAREIRLKRREDPHIEKKGKSAAKGKKCISTPRGGHFHLRERTRPGPPEKGKNGSIVIERRQSLIIGEGIHWYKGNKI